MRLSKVINFIAKQSDGDLNGVAKCNATLMTSLHGTGIKVRMNTGGSEYSFTNGFSGKDNYGMQVGGINTLIFHASPGHYLYSGRRTVQDSTRELNQYENVVFVSENCMRSWMELSGKGRKYTPYYIPNCCDETPFEPITKEQIGLKPDDTMLLVAGSIQFRKGSDIFLSYYWKILEDNPGIKIVVVGQPSYEGRQYETRIRDAVGVRMLGPVPDARPYIQMADAMINFSRVEAMPLTILEAMHLGTVNICPAVDGIPEMIEHSKSGILYTHNEHALLGKKVAVALADKEALTAESSDRYHNKFSQAKQTERYRALVESFK